MASLAPPAALAPFAEELALREKRRRQRATAELRADAREAATAAAAMARSRGPSAAELKVPSPPIPTQVCHSDRQWQTIWHYMSGLSSMPDFGFTLLENAHWGLLTYTSLHACFKVIGVPIPCRRCRSRRQASPKSRRCSGHWRNPWWTLATAPGTRMLHSSHPLQVLYFP